jgi:hypothetical protein
MKIIVLMFFLKSPFIYEAYEDNVLGKFFKGEIKKYEDTLNGEFLNIKVNSDETPYLQNEEQIIVNPLNPNNLVAVWRDFRLGYRQVGVGYSFDKGFSWTDKLIGYGLSPYHWDSDPGITCDKYGNFYVSILSFKEIYDSNAIVVYRSFNGGVSWDGPHIAVGPSYSNFEDKELIACDRTNSPYSGNLYISWTRFPETNIYLVRSTNQGITWSSPIRVSDISNNQWSVPCVDKNGYVHVFWLNYYYSAIMHDVSYNGGISFGQDNLVQYVDEPDRYLNGNILTFSYPVPIPDIYPQSPFYGTIYLVFMDTGPGGDPDIFLIKSNDGFTWTQRKRVNDDPIGNGIDQFHPWACVDSTGVLTIIFYDRRLYSNNWKFDLFLTQSFDGGETFTPNIRITTVSINPDSFKAGVIGEYIGLDSFNGIPFPLWTDTRNGNQDAYFGYYVENKISENFIKNKEFEKTFLYFDISGRKLKGMEKPSVYFLKAGKQTYKILKIGKGDLWKNLKF